LTTLPVRYPVPLELLISSLRIQTVFMSAAITEFGFGMLLLASAAMAWRWRRGMAARRIAKGLRVYTGAQVLS
jgi:hypothetical protein